MASSTPTTSGYVQATDPTKPRTDAAVPFRELIPPPGHPRINGIEASDARSWCDSRRQIEAPAWLINRLDAKNLERPFRGFTADGHVQEGLYQYDEDEGAPVEAATAAAEALLGLLTPEQRKETVFPDVEDDAIRLWSNPELYVNPGGLRLDECREDIQAAAHALLKASLSPDGYAKARGCCLTNGFLGQLVNGTRVLNEHSYNMRLFGTPSTAPDAPWGFSFFGHHLCLVAVFAGRRMVIGPSFMGAEPDRIDEGPHAGLRLFRDEELGSLELMQSLSPELQARATLAEGMAPPALAPDRWNPFDERHLGGARQDNRVVPYEGCPVTAFPPEQQDRLVSLYRAFNAYYPAPVLERVIARFRAHLRETYFAWIGPHGDDDAYYVRIHSPVAFCELDFHCGSEFVISSSDI